MIVSTGEKLFPQLVFNVYDKPPFIEWVDPKRAQTSCSSFFGLLHNKVLSWPSDNTGPLYKYLGSTLPHAKDYSDYIKNSKSDSLFIRISFNELHRGDIIAMKYNNDPDATGHMMLVRGEPILTNKKPIISGTIQYNIPILDCTSTPHGSGTDDTRNTSKVSHNGIGTGYIRLYFDSITLEPKGYVWSPNGSIFNNVIDREIYLARLNYNMVKTLGHF